MKKITLKVLKFRVTLCVLFLTIGVCETVIGVSGIFFWRVNVFSVNVNPGGWIPFGDDAFEMLLPDETYEQNARAAGHLLAVLRVYDDFLARHRIKPEFFCRYGEKIGIFSLG